jgi:Protein of unknown function (DUF2813)
LFQAFVEHLLAELYEPESAPVLALEEPETHLHPQAARTLWAHVNALPDKNSLQLIRRISFSMSLSAIFAWSDSQKTGRKFIGCRLTSRQASRTFRRLIESLRIRRACSNTTAPCKCSR